MAIAGRSAIGTVLVLVSIGLFVAGWGLTEQDRFFLFEASRTTGRVVAHEPYERQTKKPEMRYRLVVSFAGPDGQRYRFRSQATYGRPPYDVGADVPVRYDPDRPHQRARVDRRIEYLAPVVIWMGAVLLLGVLGVTIAVRGPRDDGAASGRRPPRPRRG